ncbi:site-2 protease family protein [Methanobrevibacter millerae]|uniref:Membrane-associated protease RseP, regulator of RpoE activity n=1 Tax=Methanobrevibacter millerae TaxID=230361 RepID=A0A1G5W300_9EURY|nr:site-2 protease family protein [Methanobrevibacter millerae]SDA52056.1 Membrane-associated protease RseP, regulator of RpoE activity [Methanobrevibacter millerae]
MNGIYYYLIAFTLIWILAFAFKNKLSNHGFEIDFPVIMWKTERLRGFIKRIANISPRFWKYFMSVGVVVSFGAMVFMTWTLVSSLETISTTPSVSLVIPGVEMPGSSIYVPFVYGLISLATVLIVHEFSHGILATAEKISIKSIGLLLFLVIPGAFVEPDEAELVASKKLSQLRVYAAGSVANMSLAAVALVIFLVISSFAIPANFHENGIEIGRVVGDSPASECLKEGMVIESIDNHTVDGSESYLNVVGTFKPGDNVTVGTDQGDFTLTLGKNPNNESVGYFGISAAKHYELSNNAFGPLPWIYFELLELFQWMFVLNLGIGLFNLLPMKPLDGGKMLEVLLSYKLPEHQYKPLVNSISVIMALIIIFSLVAGFL